MTSTRSTFQASSSRREASVRAGVTVAVLGGLFAFLAFTGPDNGWEWSRVWGDSHNPGWRWVFARALGTTLGISCAALALSLLFGLAGGLARLSRRPWLHQLGTVYVEVVRGTPLLVQLFIAVYCVGYSLHLDDPMMVGTQRCRR